LLGCEADISPPSTAEVVNGVAIFLLPTSHMASERGASEKEQIYLGTYVDCPKTSVG
jgi:hypothetical protein